ncbi:MAG: hypothetical protein JOZ39_12215 [Chloroflexi bacterium]|nr:hypothetical protein [Chloroflexota bacterium]
MTYELWDGELGVQLGSFESQDQALDAVRKLTSEGEGSSAPLGLTAGGLSLIASGEDLVRLAFKAA